MSRPSLVSDIPVGTGQIRTFEYYNVSALFPHSNILVTNYLE